MNILLVASTGGHLIQLLTVSSVIFKNRDANITIIIASNDFGDIQSEKLFFEEKFSIRINQMFYITDLNFTSSKVSIVKAFYQNIKIINENKVDCFLSTGALPGLIFLLACFVKRTPKRIWVDSIANVKQLSSSGNIARYFSTLCITQWQSVAKRTSKVHFMGSIM